MTTISSTSSTTSTSASTSTSTTDSSSLSSADFMKLMITELTQQDPTEPMDSSTMLNQLAQIQSLQTQQTLQDTLTKSAIASQLGSASSMIGKLIYGYDESNTEAVGQVTQVSMENSKIYLTVNGQRVPFENIMEVGDPSMLTGSSDETTTTTD